MPWVILAAALCVLVWFWPRNTLIGLAVVGTAGVLAGIAFWGYGVYDERQRFNVGAYREGRSTNIAKGNWFDDDHIINPRGTVSACWKAPGLTRDPEGDRVVWKASIIKLEFAE